MKAISAPSAHEAVLEWLLRAYEEPQRAYHTLTHVEDLLGQWEQHRQELGHPIAVGLAIWFHDSVYDPGRSDNEQESARMAQAYLAPLGVAPKLLAQVVHLVLITEGHQPIQQTPDEHWLLDADLRILGSAPERYQQYAQQIRQEYVEIPWPAYQAGRRAVLERFLDRPQLYFTPAYRDRYEAQARHNLQQEWEQLGR